MAEKDKEGLKFKVKAELALFEALQENGKLSEEGAAIKTATSATTIHYAMDRIRKRDFFEIKAVPKLEKFPEIPMAVIGFSNVHPENIDKLKEKYADKPEILQFLHSEMDIMMVVIDASTDELRRRLHDIIKLAGEKPCIYMTSPEIAKYKATVPDKVLDKVYKDLPDRRFKV